jgi:hypothetical protein
MLCFTHARSISSGKLSAYRTVERREQAGACPDAHHRDVVRAVASCGPRVLELEDDNSRDALDQPDARLVELLHPVDDVDLEFRLPAERGGSSDPPRYGFVSYWHARL